MPSFPALTHVAITVTDLDASTRWYSALFDAAPVLDEDEFTHLLETGEPPARAAESSTPSAEESS